VGQTVNVAVLVGCALLLVAVLAVRLSSRTGVPALLVYLVLGLLLGQDGLGIHFHDYKLAEQLGLVALAVILAEGGLTTRWQQARPAAAPAVVLATAGVALNVTIVGGMCIAVLGTTPRTALLLGTAVAATDSAAVFSVLRRLPLKPPLGVLLEAECGLNDAPTAVLVSLASSSSWGTRSWGVVLLLVVYQLVVGLVIGFAIGYAGRTLLGRLALPSAGLYPLATVAVVLLSYGAAGVVQASGFIAVYVAGVVVGSARMPHRRAVLGFATSLALLAELGLFVLLGVLVSPSQLWGAVPEALLVGGTALLLGRPLAVLVSLWPFGFGWREQAFLDWSGLRGAVPIVLAIVPVASGVPHGKEVLNVVFVLVVVYTLLQAPTLPWVGRRLGVVEALEARDLEVESAPLETVGADLLQVTVRPGSHLHGVYVDELRLPPGAVLSLVVRNGVGTVPTPNTILQRGDQLLVVATTASRAGAEERLRAVSRDGKLARWYKA
jgi:cell volume regulation protein A